GFGFAFSVRAGGCPAFAPAFKDIFGRAVPPFGFSFPGRAGGFPTVPFCVVQPVSPFGFAFSCRAGRCPAFTGGLLARGPVAPAAFFVSGCSKRAAWVPSWSSNTRFGTDFA